MYRDEEMLFNTPEYILFLPIVVFLYYLVPKRLRYIWLLGVSYYFYMQWNPLYLALLLFCTLITYAGGLILEKLKSPEADREGKGEWKKRLCFFLCITANLGVLAFFKYASFGISLLNRMLSWMDVSPVSWEPNILLPVGISFYTLQALGYLIDVYRGDIYAEKNLIRYALFVSFFPQLVAGPIERSKNLLVQLHEFHSFDYEKLRKGLLLILYGLFLKMVIADRAAVIVDTVYKDSSTYPGFYIVVATFFFAIQIYCDFYGYSTIARGSALLMGITLMDNFQAPYFSKSVREFWRRWHISLSGWFRDYLYIPLGGSRRGVVRKEANRLFVFAVSGLWHGASLAFLTWGLLNGIYQVAEDLVDQFRRKLQSLGGERARTAERFSKGLFQTMRTFFLVTAAWLFFRSGGLSESLEMIRNLFGSQNLTILFDGSLYGLGVGRNYMYVLLASILLLFVVDYHKYQGRDVADIFLRQGWWFQTAVIMLFIFTILLYGCYGEMYDTQQFIYFQF